MGPAQPGERPDHLAARWAPRRRSARTFGLRSADSERRWLRTCSARVNRRLAARPRHHMHSLPPTPPGSTRSRSLRRRTVLPRFSVVPIPYAVAFRLLALYMLGVRSHRIFWRQTPRSGSTSSPRRPSAAAPSSRLPSSRARAQAQVDWPRGAGWPWGGRHRLSGNCWRRSVRIPASAVRTAPCTPASGHQVNGERNRMPRDGSHTPPIQSDRNRPA